MRQTGRRMSGGAAASGSATARPRGPASPTNGQRATGEHVLEPDEERDMEAGDAVRLFPPSRDLLAALRPHLPPTAGKFAIVSRLSASLVALYHHGHCDSMRDL